MATFHVDYIGGSNTNDGSAANPYATIKYAIETNTLGIGDEVKVKGSGTTTVDTAATFNNNNTLNTSSDLSTTLAPGDIVQIDPPAANTALQGWIWVRVTDITQTTIGFREEIILPGNLNNGNWTIKKLDEYVNSTASTFETWASGSIGGYDIIGGYDATFTNIIGKTFFRKDVGAGSSSGTCFSTNTSTSSINGGNTPNFENFGFFHWQNPIRGGFGGSHFGDNLMCYQSTNTAFGYFGSCTKKGTGPNNIDMISSSSVPWYWSYSSPAIAALGYGTNTNLRSFSSERAPRILDTNLADVTVWGSGQNANGAGFGGTNLLRWTSGTLYGDLTIIGPDQNRSGFNKTAILLGFEKNFTQGSINLSSFTKFTGGSTSWFYDFAEVGDSEASACTINIQMPTGYDLTTEPICAGRDLQPWISGNITLTDDNYTWFKQPGGYAAIDSTDFDTGINSKVLFVGTKAAYGLSEDANGPIFGFNKQATNPTSITLRYKVDLSQSTQSNARVEFVSAIGQYNYGLTPQVNLTATDWADATFNWETNVNDLIPFTNAPVGTFFPLSLKFQNNYNQIVYVDSITLNY